MTNRIGPYCSCSPGPPTRLPADRIESSRPSSRLGRAGSPTPPRTPHSSRPPLRRCPSPLAVTPRRLPYRTRSRPPPPTRPAHRRNAASLRNSPCRKESRLSKEPASEARTPLRRTAAALAFTPSPATYRSSSDPAAPSRRPRCSSASACRRIRRRRRSSPPSWRARRPTRPPRDTCFSLRLTLRRRPYCSSLSPLPTRPPSRTTAGERRCSRARTALSRRSLRW